MGLTLRAGGAKDADQVARVQHEGYDGYRSFAPKGWSPPEPRGELELTRRRLADPAVWCLIAEEDGEPAGQVVFMPASLHPVAATESTLAHLWQLFVRPRWWGSGLARRLHAEAVQAAAERGFTAMRLFTPAGQARARRFYEREGWTAVGEPEEDMDFGLPLVEYRRALDGATRPPGRGTPPGASSA